MAVVQNARVRSDWLGPAIVGALTVSLYAGSIGEMVREWWTSPNASHGFLVVPIVLYLAWLKRERAARAPRGASAWGIPVIVAAVLMLLVGRWAEIEFVGPLSLVVLLGGYGLHFLGAGVMRQLAFPYAFLIFMVPWPDLLVEFISFPMQLISATYAAMLVGLLGIPVTRTGVDIALPNVTFSVAVPCSGMNSLVSLLALAALLAYLSRGVLWRRAALFAAGAPMALLANVLRIVCILLIGTLWGQKAAEGFFHNFSGIVLFLGALLGLLALAQALAGLDDSPQGAPGLRRLLAGLPRNEVRQVGAREVWA